MMRPQSNSIFWVIATLAIAMAPQVPRMSVLVAVMSLAPLVWRLAAELNDWKPLKSLVRYAATAISLIALVVSIGGLFGRRASVSLLAALLALKLLECERIRDARLLVSFSFFLCATQFLFTQGIFMLVYGVATIIVGLVALAQLQRQEAFEPLGAVPSMKASMLSDLTFSLRLLLLAVPIAIAFFLFFPRWATPLWGVPESSLDAKSGLSDSMAPGSIQNLFMDDSPALRVAFDGRLPAPSELYWRGPVLWQYKDNTWTGSFYGRNIAVEPMPDDRDARWRYTVQLEPNERNWLFALDYPTLTPQDTRISMDFQMLRRQPVTQLLQYRMASNPEYVDTPELQVTLRSMALELPDGLNPRTRELMDRWHSETPDARALIQRVLRHFNQQDFHYSLEAPLLGRNAVDDFLFSTQTGYCEHYASAFAVMMRMAGIPSRVVTGYQGGWYSELGKYLLVRQSDAHAWTEVWLPADGWTRVDPTAAVSPLRVQQGSLGAITAPRHLLDYPWVRTVRNGVDLLEQRWNDWVIEFSAQGQAHLFASFGLDYLSPAGLVGVLFGFLGVLSLILLPLIFRTVVPGDKDPVKRAWQKFLRRLKKAGCPHQASHGAMELAFSASNRLPANLTEIYHIAHLYNRHRYSAEPPGPGEIQSAVRNFHPHHKDR
jgi:transglutaminase-like putative cysteine protease